jgi:hypothetical protein
MTMRPGGPTTIPNRSAEPTGSPPRADGAGTDRWRCLSHRLHAPLHGLIVVLLATAAARACPFCGVVATPLAERRDRAVVAAVGEPTGGPRKSGGTSTQDFAVLSVIRTTAGAAAAGDTVEAVVPGPIAGTALLFAEPGVDAAGKPRWSAVAADETLIGHVAAAPSLDRPAAERLAWFAGRLEHADPAVAADAFAEFGVATFADVVAAAPALDPGRLAAWVNEPGIDQRRRGFYGLALGIAARATRDPAARKACVAALVQGATAAGDDFRAGYDGILAGLLVAEGPRALDRLEPLGLVGPRARPIDQRHLLAALRFARENLADSIPPERIAAATAALLASPAVAADAAVDLARYRAWDRVDAVARLWTTLGGDDPLVRRAVAGYLTACPLPAAKEHLERLAGDDPDRLRQAVEAAGLPAGR